LSRKHVINAEAFTGFRFRLEESLAISTGRPVIGAGYRKYTQWRKMI
jgi:hypothetical protein